MKKLIKGYLKFNDWVLRFFLEEHILISATLIGVGLGTVIGSVLGGLIKLIRGLASLRKSS